MMKSCEQLNGKHFPIRISQLPASKGFLFSLSHFPTFSLFWPLFWALFLVPHVVYNLEEEQLFWFDFPLLIDFITRESVENFQRLLCAAYSQQRGKSLLGLYFFYLNFLRVFRRQKCLSRVSSTVGLNKYFSKAPNEIHISTEIREIKTKPGMYIFFAISRKLHKSVESFIIMDFQIIIR